MPPDSSVFLLVGADAALVDESSYARALTAGGNAARTTLQAKFGAGSLTFDGSGDRVQTPADAAFALGAGDFTLEGWFRLVAKNNGQAMMGQWDNGGSLLNSAWFLFITGNKLTFRYAVDFSSAKDIAASWAPTLGQWYHIAVERQGSTGRVYVDGAVHATVGTFVGTLNGCSHPLTLGTIGTTASFPLDDYNGQMDEIRLTKGVARYGGPFTPPAAAFPRDTVPPSTYAQRVVADGASHYWRLNGGDTTALDSVGTAHATLSGGGTLQQPGALADGDGCIVFGGVNGKGVTTELVSIPVTGTFEAWIRPVDGSRRTIFSVGSAHPTIYFDSGTVVVYEVGLPQGAASGVLPVTPGVWHHVVLVFNGATLTMYLDGVLDRVVPFTRPVATTAVASLGNDPVWGADPLAWWLGGLDEVAIYPGAATAAQVLAHYQARALPYLPGDYAYSVIQDGASHYWRLNEATGTLADDAVGSANGTLSGAVTKGQPGAVTGDTAMRFDGASGKIVTSVGTALVSPFSVELWVRQNSTTVNQVLFVNTWGAGDNLALLLDGAGGFFIYTGGTNVLVPFPYDKNWHHLACVSVGGTALKVYVDGVDVPGNPAPFTFTAGIAKAFELGWDPNWTYFNGTLDEVAVYPVALTQAQISAHYALRRTVPLTYSEQVLSDGASAYWKLDETSGLVADDAVGSADGTISGGVTLGQAGALVAAGNTAFSFNGTTGKIATTALTLPATVTVEAWCKTTSATDYIAMFSNRDASLTGTRVFVALDTTAGAVLFVDRPAPVFVGNGVPRNDGQWHHVVAVLTPTAGSIYVDGVLNDTRPLTQQAPAALPVTIGFDYDTGHWWPGTLDEIAVYPLALTAPQITAHYVAGLSSGDKGHINDLLVTLLKVKYPGMDLASGIQADLAARPQTQDATTRFLAMLDEAGL